MPCLDIFGLEFEKKLLSCFKSALSTLTHCKILPKKHKWLNLGLEMPYLGIFGLEF